MEIGATSITMPAFGSAISQAIYIATHGPATTTVSLGATGLWSIALSSSATLDETGNALTRLGFTAAPYSSAASFTAAAMGIGLSAPYEVDVATYDVSSAYSEDKGVPLYAAHVRRHRALSEWRRPVFTSPLEFAAWHRAVEDWNAYLSTPAEIDVLYDDDGTLGYTTLAVDDLRVRVRDPKSLIAELSISCQEPVT